MVWIISRVAGKATALGTYTIHFGLKGDLITTEHTASLATISLDLQLSLVHANALSSLGQYMTKWHMYPEGPSDSMCTPRETTHSPSCHWVSGQHDE